MLLRLAVKTGSLDEADDQQGLAHFVEHMLFEGTRHFPGQGITVKKYADYAGEDAAKADSVW